LFSCIVFVLCERAFRSRVTLRKEGEVALPESPNGLGATAESKLRGEGSRTKFPAILCRRDLAISNPDRSPVGINRWAVSSLVRRWGDLAR